MPDEDFARLAAARVTIAGLGLMGGSLALALKGNCRELIGVDTNPAATELALERRIVDRVAGFESGATETDLLILAAPVRGILTQLARLIELGPPSRPTVVLDLGSTKSAIATAMQSLPLGWDPIGGHPMCGKEVSGVAHAERGLFRDKIFVLAPLERTSPDALGLAQAVVAAIGSRPLYLEAVHHDALAASSSHLPYVVAALLVRAAEAAQDDGVWMLAASGFRDTSRLAASDVDMMLDILLTNRSAILNSLSRYQLELGAIASLLQAGDADALRAFLTVARDRRAQPLWADK